MLAEGTRLVRRPKRELVLKVEGRRGSGFFRPFLRLPSNLQPHNASWKMHHMHMCMQQLRAYSQRAVDIQTQATVNSQGGIGE